MLWALLFRKLEPNTKLEPKKLEPNKKLEPKKLLYRAMHITEASSRASVQLRYRAIHFTEG